MSKRLSRKFIDAIRIYARGGAGGNGLPTYGGVGGKGGNIYVKAFEGGTLQKLMNSNPKKRWIGNVGDSSRKFRILGDPGEDMVIPSPVGTVISTDSKLILGELNKHGDEVLVAAGGKGGNPSNNYLGQRGQINQVTLELKLIADIGLVGFPNAGKSTLLKAISRAKPKIASYPFTTIQPNIGNLEYEDLRQITLADLPGLIEGAWKNHGMGHNFLKHVERTKMILFIIDIDGFRLSPQTPYRSPLETFLLLNKELELYRPDLTEKPAALVINKLDTEDGEEKLQEFLHQFDSMKEQLHKYPEEMQPKYLMNISELIPCSFKYNQHSVSYLKERLRILLDVHDESEKQLAVIAENQLGIVDKLKEKNIRLI